MQDGHLSACHECDLLHRIESADRGQTLLCRRCGAVLHAHKPNSVRVGLPLTIAGLILYAIANAYPLLEIRSGSLYHYTTLMGSVEALFAREMWLIGILVFCSAVLFPLLELLSYLYILLPLSLNKNPPYLNAVLSLVGRIKPWGMMEVFMLGILVSIIKLVKMMKVIPGLSLFAFTTLIFVLAAISATFDVHGAWEKVKWKQT